MIILKITMYVIQHPQYYFDANMLFI